MPCSTAPTSKMSDLVQTPKDANQVTDADEEV